MKISILVLQLHIIELNLSFSFYFHSGIMPLIDNLKGYPLEYLIAFLVPLVFHSYIHPDEHFQSIEPLAGKLLGYSVQLPWEYTSENPARSYGVLYLYYGPLMWCIKTFFPFISPMNMLSLLRFQNLLVSAIVTTWSFSKLIHHKKQFNYALHFVVTSYVYEVYQSHTFSNSIETAIVLLVLALIESLPKPDKDFQLPIVCRTFLLGMLFSVGIFNRVTFVAWMLAPSWFIITHIVRNKMHSIPMVMGFGLMSSFLIITDSIAFGRSFNDLLSLPLKFIVTPWNNLVYNSQYENLAQHGIHAWYTHVLVNVPQIIGPGVLLLFKGIPWTKVSVLPVLSAVGGIVVLSFIPHQELRFLTPILPLACSIFNYDGDDVEEVTSKTNIKENHDGQAIEFASSSFRKILTIVWTTIGLIVVALVWKYHSPSAPFIWYIFGGTVFTTTDFSSLLTSRTDDNNPFFHSTSNMRWLFLKSWVFFNLAMNVLMGIYHQGGVVSVLDKFHNEFFISSSEATTDLAIIFWRTYSPPSWILGDKAQSLEALTFNEHALSLNLDMGKSTLIDFMGVDIRKVCSEAIDLIEMKKQVYMVLPKGSFPTAESKCNNLNWTEVDKFHYPYHYDLDHFDISEPRTFIPGLGVYKVDILDTH